MKVTHINGRKAQPLWMQKKKKAELTNLIICGKYRVEQRAEVTKQPFIRKAYHH